MLDLAKVNEVVTKAASPILNKQAGINRVESEPMVDSWGDEALHITIVLRGDSIAGSPAMTP